MTVYHTRGLFYCQFLCPSSGRQGESLLTYQACKKKTWGAQRAAFVRHRSLRLFTLVVFAQWRHLLFWIERPRQSKTQDISFVPTVTSLFNWQETKRKQYKSVWFSAEKQLCRAWCNPVNSTVWGWVLALETGVLHCIVLMLHDVLLLALNGFHLLVLLNISN